MPADGMIAAAEMTSARPDLVARLFRLPQPRRHAKGQNQGVQMTAVGTFETSSYVCFSNRPFKVKRFQTIYHHSVDVAHGLVLLFGIGTKALPSWGSKTRWNNLKCDLAVKLTAGPSGHANSPHPSSREGHHSTARWSSSVLLSDLILHGFH